MSSTDYPYFLESNDYPRICSLPATRNSDPRTSLDAERANQSYRIQYVNELIAFVKLHPGWVATEIAAATGIDRYEVSRRLSDCKKLDELVIGESRIAKGHTRKEMTWYPK